MSELPFSPRITPTAPLMVDPVAYLNFHHSVGRCLANTPFHD